MAWEAVWAQKRRRDAMKGVFVSLFMLFVVALTNLSYGDVTITAQDIGGGKLKIGYQTTGGVVPVAFGLNIQLSNGATFSNVTPTTGAFSFYPSRFRDYINPQNPNWQDPEYLPIPAWNEPDALGGLGTSGLTIETAAMVNPYLANGSAADFDLDGIININDTTIFSQYWLAENIMTDLNGDGLINFRDYAIFLDGHFESIPTSGDLLLLQINGNGAQTTAATISLNLLRGGIVLEDASLGNAILPTNVTVIIPEPATLLLFTIGGLFLRNKK
jgi:hypothetical protein